MSSLSIPRGSNRLNLNLPLGGSSTGKLLGASLPLPFTLFFASSSGTNSNDTNTLPYDTFLPSPSFSFGWYTSSQIFWVAAPPWFVTLINIYVAFILLHALAIILC